MLRKQRARARVGMHAHRVPRGLGYYYPADSDLGGIWSRTDRRPGPARPARASRRARPRPLSIACRIAASDAARYPPGGPGLAGPGGPACSLEPNHDSEKRGKDVCRAGAGAAPHRLACYVASRSTKLGCIPQASGGCCQARARPPGPSESAGSASVSAHATRPGSSARPLRPESAPPAQTRPAAEGKHWQGGRLVAAGRPGPTRSSGGPGRTRSPAPVQARAGALWPGMPAKAGRRPSKRSPGPGSVRVSPTRTDSLPPASLSESACGGHGSRPRRVGQTLVAHRRWRRRHRDPLPP
jgi:hypothetical protein